MTMDGKLMAVSVGGGAEMEAGRPRLLFQTRIRPYHFGVEYGASPDGQRFLLAEPVEAAPTPFQVVLNWPALMQRRRGAKVTGP